MIDPHVHCRDWNQKGKETIEHALHVAERAGISGIFDMPNTDPAITSIDSVEWRLKTAYKARSPVFYGLYIGLTSNMFQIKDAVKIHNDNFPQVVGLKMFAGHSVGNLGIIREEDQKLVYNVLAHQDFQGVLAVHCEKEAYIKKDMWDPTVPISHSFARPEDAEVKSIEDQIEFASWYGFNGTLHIAHVSVPESVELIDRVRKAGKIKITCGVTPHHCMLSYDMIPSSEQGLLYKVNPPLRNSIPRKMMIPMLKQGKIDWIETDHAPHILKEKLESPYMSGFPGLPYYPHFIKHLRKEGFTEEQLKDLTHNNICKAFNVEIPELGNVPELDLENEYQVDVYNIIR